MMKDKKLKWYWHIHHDILLEALTGPLKNRIKYIKNIKPKDEIELRLKLIKPVKGKIPSEVVKACDKYDEARDRYNKTRDGYDKTQDGYYEAQDRYNKALEKRSKTLEKHQPYLKKLHKKECGCGYGWTKKTIFTKKNGLKKDY